MKIVLVNVTYKKGSTGSIVGNLFDKFSEEGNETYYIYGRGPKISAENVFKRTLELESKIHHFISKISGNMYGGMFFSTKRIIRLIKKIKPDVVNLHCVNGYFVNIYKLISWLAKNKIKTVLTMHADFMMTGGCGYALDCDKYINNECKNCQFVRDFNGKLSLNRTNHFYKKLMKSISKFDKELLTVSTVSPWLKDRYSLSNIYRNYYIQTIINPVEKIFFCEPSNNPYKDTKNVLYVTPDIYDFVKSGWLIKDIASLRPDLHFTIVCTKDVDFTFNNENITYIKGGLTREKLRDYYFFADVTLILSKRETFSMVVGESLACGTPVVGFKSGGPETITLEKYSNFIEYGDIKGIAKVLCKYDYDKNVIRKEASKKYGVNSISKQYLELFKR